MRVVSSSTRRSWGRPVPQHAAEGTTQGDHVAISPRKGQLHVGPVAFPGPGNLKGGHCQLLPVGMIGRGVDHHAGGGVDEADGIVLGVNHRHGGGGGFDHGEEVLLHPGHVAPRRFHLFEATAVAPAFGNQNRDQGGTGQEQQSEWQQGRAEGAGVLVLKHPLAAFGRGIENDLQRLPERGDGPEPRVQFMARLGAVCAQVKAAADHAFQDAVIAPDRITDAGHVLQESPGPGLIKRLQVLAQLDKSGARVLNGLLGRIVGAMFKRASCALERQLGRKCDLARLRDFNREQRLTVGVEHIEGCDGEKQAHRHHAKRGRPHAPPFALPVR